MSNPVATKLEDIQRNTLMTAREIAEVLNTTPETISRWRGGKTDPQPKLRDGLLNLAWLASELAELYPANEAHLWLYSPHKLLGGLRAVDLIQAGEGERVLKIIAQLKDGAYL